MQPPQMSSDGCEPQKPLNVKKCRQSRQRMQTNSEHPSTHTDTHMHSQAKTVTAAHSGHFPQLLLLSLSLAICLPLSYLQWVVVRSP